MGGNEEGSLGLRRWRKAEGGKAEGRKERRKGRWIEKGREDIHSQF